MDLQLSPQQRDLRDEVRTWLANHVPKRPLPPVSTKDGLEAHREWEMQLYAAGLSAVHWPVEHGGRGLDALETSVFTDEYVRAGAPDRANRLGLGLAGPTLIDRGDAAQQQRWLAPILRCEQIWCQGFSEPGAGSDLAGVTTRGEVGPDAIVVNGQKIWTSGAMWADWMFALVRTEPGSTRHAGLTFLMIDMTDPGVDVRPLRQINDAPGFAEVFLTDVVVAPENVVGGLGNGWSVAMSTLGHERGSGLNTAAHFQRMLSELIELLGPERLAGDSRIRHEVARLHEQIEAYRYLTLRTLSELSRHRRPGPQSYMGKLWWSQLQVRLYELGMDALGAEAELTDAAGPAGDRHWRRRYWLARAACIYAGSNEIQRNIVAERVLGLPKDDRRAV